MVDTTNSSQENNDAAQPPTQSVQSGVIFSPLVKKGFQLVRKELSLPIPYGDIDAIEGTGFSILQPTEGDDGDTELGEQTDGPLPSSPGQVVNPATTEVSEPSFVAAEVSSLVAAEETGNFSASTETEAKIDAPSADVVGSRQDRQR